MTVTAPVLEFTSHIAGKNAKVRVFPDRIEWEVKSLMSTKAKAITAAATAGMSYLATGFTGKRADEMIPIRSISSITSKKGLRNTLLTFIATGNTIEMNVSHGEAVKVKNLVQSLMLDPHAADSSAASASAPEVDAVAELQRFAGLRDQGLITADDYEAKKRQLLGL